MNPYFMTPAQLSACAGSLRTFYADAGAGLGSDLGVVAQSDPEPYSKAALSIIDTITQFFGIGAGRKEADQITPVQNRVVNEVIAPISAQLNSPNADQITVTQWQDMLNAVQKTQQAWLSFLHNTDWTDGRAATQAENTLESYFDGEITQIQQRILTAPNSWFDFSGTPHVASDPGIPGNPVDMSHSTTGSSILSMGASTLVPVVIGGLALWYLLGRGKKSSGMNFGL